MLKAIIFDLYGTLIDAEGLFYEVSNLLSKKTSKNVEYIEKEILNLYSHYFKDYYLKNFKPEKYYYKMLFNEIIKKYNLKEDAKYYIDFMYESFSKLPYFKDIDYLNEIKKKNIYVSILTNADSYFVRKKINSSQIYYEDLIISEEVELYKPDKKIFELALQRLNLNKEEIIFIGDNLITDIKATKDIGIKSLRIDRKGKGDISSLYELINYI
jgi:putative hydrolase of the HAD superfamily